LLKRPPRHADTPNMRGTEFESFAAGGGARGPDPVARHEVVSRLRRQIASGAYEPPVDEVVDRVMSIILAGHTRNAPGPRP
jgi:hypothetical protein